MGRLRGIGRSGTIGVDIDRGSIKAVQLQGSGAGYVLQHVGYHRLPPGVIVDGEVADQNLLSSEIRDFWDSHSFKGRSITFGVSNQKVVVRLLDFPHMRPEDLQGAISFEAQDHIPMPLDEAVLDYVVLGPREERSDLDRVLVVAAQREMISRYTSAVRAGGLKPEGVDVKALSLTRSTLPDPFFGEDGAVLLLDVGAEITNLVVADRGNPVLTRFVPVGLGDFVAAVVELADIAEDEAERQALDPRVNLGDGRKKMKRRISRRRKKTISIPHSSTTSGVGWRAPRRRSPTRCSGPSSTTVRRRPPATSPGSSSPVRRP